MYAPHVRVDKIPKYQVMTGGEWTELRHCRKMICVSHHSTKHASTVLMPSWHAPLPTSGVSHTEQHSEKAFFLGILALKPADTNLRRAFLLETFVPASDSDLLMSVALDLRFLSAIRTFLLSVLGVETFYMYRQSVLGHRWIIKLDSNCWYSHC